jgi:vesicle coat complex subunit
LIGHQGIELKGMKFISDAVEGKDVAEFFPDVVKNVCKNIK